MDSVGGGHHRRISSLTSVGPDGVRRRKPPKRFFIIPSSMNAEGFEYEVEIFSTHELRVVPVVQKWAFRHVWRGVWDAESAGGRRSKAASRSKRGTRRTGARAGTVAGVGGPDKDEPSGHGNVLAKWYNNPQLRLQVVRRDMPKKRKSTKVVTDQGDGTQIATLTVPQKAQKVVACVMLREDPANAPGIRTAVHVCQNEWSTTFDSHRCIVPNAERHHIVAASAGGYTGSHSGSRHESGQRTIVCELQRSTEKRGGTNVEFPYFVVPSTSKVGQCGGFTVEIVSTGQLDVAEVTPEDRIGA